MGGRSVGRVLRQCAEGVEGLCVACRPTSKGVSASAGWGRADTRRHSGYVYCNEETPLTFESHPFPEDMVNAFRYPLPRPHKQRAGELREHDHGSPRHAAVAFGTWAEAQAGCTTGIRAICRNTQHQITRNTLHQCSCCRSSKNCVHFSICACHPCAGAMLIFSVSFQFYRMILERNPLEDACFGGGLQQIVIWTSKVGG